MKLQNISKKLLTGVVFTAALVSCSEDKMDEINKDHNHTTAVPAKMILTDVMTSTAFSVVSGDFNLYGGMYVEHETGSHNQFYYAETRSSCTSASTFNNSWGGNLFDTERCFDLCQSRRRRAELHNKRHCGTFRGLQFGDLDRYVW